MDMSDATEGAPFWQLHIAAWQQSGLTHIAGKDRRGRYLVKRKTARKKMRRSLELMRLWCRKHRHEPLAWQ